MIFKSTWQCLVCIKGILWRMIAKWQFLLGFEITFGHKSGFRVTFRAQLESLACFSGVSVSGLKKMGRSVAACLQAQEMSSWWQAVVSSESPFTCPQLLLEAAELPGCCSPVQGPGSCSVSGCWKLSFPHRAKLFSSPETGRLSFAVNRVLDSYLTVGGFK